MASTIQNFAHAVKYEFAPDRDGDMRLSNEIVNALARAEDLMVCLGAWPVELNGGEDLSEIRHSIESALEQLARSLEPYSAVLQEEQEAAPVALDRHLAGGEPAWVATAIDKLQELQMACRGILRLA